MPPERTTIDADIRTLVERIHGSSALAVIAVAGAGTQAIAWLLGVPGASRTVLEALVPYSDASLTEFLGYAPDQSVGAKTAQDMARAAYRRAHHLRQGEVPVVGVACTAAIATDRSKRGEHRCHVAAWTADAVRSYSLQFVKGLRERDGEEEIASKLVLQALLEASRVEGDLALELDARERVQVQHIQYDDPIKALLNEHVSSVTVHPEGTIVADQPVHGAILAGSFHPFHEGHDRLAAAASEVLNSEVTFELSVTNVDKPPLEEPEIRTRLAQFSGQGRLVITRALVFFQKARLFPGCTFVIGWDTAVRLVEPRYYGGGMSSMLDALVEIRKLGCRFLVAGRVDDEVFRALDDVPVPKGFEDIFSPIPESAFRFDLSSTELRMAGRRR